MTDDITIYHTPRCSKSRATLELLKNDGRDPQLVEYLKEPPTAQTLNAILDMLGMQPRDLMRKKEKEYREAGLDNPDLGRDELIGAMIEHPRLIERPIVIANGRRRCWRFFEKPVHRKDAEINATTSPQWRKGRKENRDYNKTHCHSRAGGDP